MKKFLIIIQLTLFALMANAQLCPDYNHPHAIDLGLPSGTKWACCNVGATNFTEPGSKFAWGETEEKEIYDFSTYVHCDGHRSDCHKLGVSICGTEYDVARKKWGGNWQMPTEKQLDELRRCKIDSVTINGVKGFKLTSRNNGLSIFLPGELYWSGTQHRQYGGSAYSLLLKINSTIPSKISFAGRNEGLLIRPVWSDK